MEEITEEDILVDKDILVDIHWVHTKKQIDDQNTKNPSDL